MTSPPNPYSFLPHQHQFQEPRRKRPQKPDFCSGRKTRRRKGAAYDRPFSQRNAPRAAGHARTGPAGGGGCVCDGGAHCGGARPRAPFAVPAPGPALPRGLPILQAGRVPARIDAWLAAGRQARPRPGRGRLDGAGGVEGGCLGSRAAGQPAPPAGIRAGCLRPRQNRRGRCRRPPPGITPRPGLPAFPSGRAGLPSCRAAQPGRGAFGLSQFLRPGRPGLPPAAASPAGAGLDAAGRAERPSSRTHGRARARADEEGWLGEIEGLDLTLAFLRDKRKRLERTTTSLGMPVRKQH